MPEAHVRRRTRNGNSAGLLLAVLIAAAAAAIHLTTGRFWLDLGVYRQAGAAVWHGESLYDFVMFGERGNSLAYVYPPFAAVLLVPFGLLNADLVIFIWTLVSVLALITSVRLLSRHLGYRRPVAITLLCLPLYPIFNNLQVGQVNLLLMAVVLADLLGVVPHRLRGVGIGLAAAIKLTPAIFVLYLLLTGRPREAARACGAFAVATALGFALLPKDSWTYWSGTFLDGSRVAGDPRTINNQSLHAAMARVFGVDGLQPWWLATALIVGVAGLWIAARASRSGQELTGIVACAITGLLVSPVSWQNHWVWCVPLLLLVSRRVAVVLWALFLSSGLWVVVTATGHDNDFTGPLLAFSCLYVVIGLAFLTSVAVRQKPARTGSPRGLPP